MNKAAVNKAFFQINGKLPVCTIRAPGRVNIIGEHTDYNHGLVLPGTIDKALYFAVGFNQSDQLRFWALDIDQYATVKLSDIENKPQLWLNYLLGIAEQFQQRGYLLPGLDVVFGGDLPIGAGISSSAALECGMALAWDKLLNAKLSRIALARLAQDSSQQFLGIPCGIMDQFAVLHGQKDRLILLDCKDLNFEIKTAAIKGCDWVLLNTHISHQLASSEYPLRVAECKGGLEKLQRFFPDSIALRDLSVEQLTSVEKELSAKEYLRCRYVITEHERTLQMVAALAKGDAKKAGKLLTATHMGLRDDYEVSCPEIDCFFDFAQQHAAVHGSRLMGGGFGGCTLNLVKSAEKATFVDAALAHYEQAMDRKGEAIAVKLSKGAEVL